MSREPEPLVTKEIAAETSSGSMLTSVPAYEGDEFVLLGGRAHLSPREWPTRGPLDAPLQAALLFDISCKQCRALYRLLTRTSMASSARAVAVLLIPVPLHPNCNPKVSLAKVTSPEACPLAQLFLSVWQSQTHLFEEFSQWLMAPVDVPTLKDAQRWLRQHGGILEPQPIESLIAHAVELYGRSPSEKLPQLLLKDRLVVGLPVNLDDLFKTAANESILVSA
jgi:hypothetical protein